MQRSLPAHIFPSQQEGHAHAAAAAAASRTSVEAVKNEGSTALQSEGVLDDSGVASTAAEGGSSVQGDGSVGEGMHHQHDEAERTEQLAILNRMVKDLKIKLAQVRAVPLCSVTYKRSEYHQPLCLLLYLRDGTQFSHSLCPTIMRTHRPPKRK